ncbi:MAG: class I SAM-dependent methyltransferase [Nanoarchaeota archaeon]
MDTYKKVARCRVCGSEELINYFDLGKTPLANSLVELKDKGKKEKKFPLEVLYCKNCSLSQLSIVVDPKILFLRYVYRSSMSKTFQAHCAEMADSVISLLGPSKKELVVDIASNDGCLLEQFKKRGFRVMGVEPAENIAKIANSKGIETLCKFWDDGVAETILKKYGKAKVITATNVFAHVDDLSSFLKAVSILLDENGLFIIEVPYLYNLLAKNEFDTIYHEHLSYFLVKPLKVLLDRNKLKIFRVEKYSIHGGSLRVFASKGNLKGDGSLRRLLEFEDKKGLYSTKSYRDFEAGAKEIKKNLLKLLAELAYKNKKIAAFGASAKGNTLLNYCGIDSKLIRAVIDDTPEKQNHIYPGTGIKIVDRSYLDKEKPDYVLLLAWNFADEIIKKLESAHRGKFRYIIPIPAVKVV